MTENAERSKVKVISRNGESALVEFALENGLQRKYIPLIEVGDGHVLNSVLSCGIDYGYTWEDIEIEFNSPKFAAEMHNVGIWTAEDALKNPQKLWSALNAILADNISKILQIAIQEKKRGK